MRGATIDLRPFVVDARAYSKHHASAGLLFLYARRLTAVRRQIRSLDRARDSAPSLTVWSAILEETDHLRGEEDRLQGKLAEVQALFDPAS